MSIPVYFFNEKHSFRLRNKNKIKYWIKNTIQNEGFSLEGINVIFTSDQHLLEINKEHLNHDYYTDIITFNYNENQQVSSDLFISVDRVKDNAKSQKTTFTNEMHRVIIHGVLHLLGYNDKTDAQIAKMRSKEDYYLKELTSGILFAK